MQTKHVNRYKKRIFDIIQIGQREDFPSRAFDFFIVVVILLNISVLFLETFDFSDVVLKVFRYVELFSIIIFGLEYALRIWTAEYLYPNLSKKKAVLRFLISFDGVVDFLTILPFFFLSGFVVFRMLRVVRIFHLFRINANYDSFNVITSVIYEKRNQIMSSVFIILILMISSSLGMYSAEHEAQPDVFDNAFSGMWWSISTILTVGYGDIYPITTLGRAMAIIIALLGVGVVAIPTGIISAGFVEHYTLLQKSEEEKGKSIHSDSPRVGVLWLVDTPKVQDILKLLIDGGAIPVAFICGETEFREAGSTGTGFCDAYVVVDHPDKAEKRVVAEVAKEDKPMLYLSVGQDYSVLIPAFVKSLSV